MSTPVSTHGRITDISFAPHPLNEGVTPRAARIAEGARRASSAQLLTAASQLACDLVAAVVMASFLSTLLIWGCVITGRM